MTDDGKSCAAIRAELAEARSDLAIALDQRNTAWKQRDRFMGERDDARRAHDALHTKLAAIKASGPSWLADAAEALGQKGMALNWSQVISEIRELRHRFDTEVEHHKLTLADRDKWLAEAKRLTTPEPAKAPTDTRPVVKVGQVWRDDYDGQVVRIARLEDGEASVVVIEKGRSSSPVGEESWIGICIDGTTYSGTWHLVTDAPEPVKVEPFELVSTGRPIAEYAATPNECAIRDRIQEIECRLAKLEASK